MKIRTMIVAHDLRAIALYDLPYALHGDAEFLSDLPKRPTAAIESHQFSSADHSL
jgi:hypothetical protein